MTKPSWTCQAIFVDVTCWAMFISWILIEQSAIPAFLFALDRFPKPMWASGGVGIVYHASWIVLPFKNLPITTQGATTDVPIPSTPMHHLRWFKVEMVQRHQSLVVESSHPATRVEEFREPSAPSEFVEIYNCALVICIEYFPCQLVTRNSFINMISLCTCWRKYDPGPGSGPSVKRVGWLVDYSRPRQWKVRTPKWPRRLWHGRLSWQSGVVVSKLMFKVSKCDAGLHILGLWMVIRPDWFLRVNFQNWDIQDGSFDWKLGLFASSTTILFV